MNRKILGNILIVTALGLAFFTYYPIIRLYLQPISKVSTPKTSGFYLTIPKIGAQAPIISNVNPWKNPKYLPVLERGIAQAQGSSEPEASGTIFLFAHSSDVPWHLARYNTIFLRLGDLKKGDKIILTKDGKNYTYQVIDKKEVWPNDTQYLKKIEKDQLILQTCIPIGTSLKRLLIFAQPI